MNLNFAKCWDLAYFPPLLELVGKLHRAGMGSHKKLSMVLFNLFGLLIQNVSVNISTIYQGERFTCKLWPNSEVCQHSIPYLLDHNNVSFCLHLW
jgi:hypothetical protein